MNSTKSKIFVLAMTLAATLFGNAKITTPNDLRYDVPGLVPQAPVAKMLVGKWNWIGAASRYNFYAQSHWTNPNSLEFVQAKKGAIDLIVKKDGIRYSISDIRFNFPLEGAIDLNGIIGNYLDGSGKAVKEGSPSSILGKKPDGTRVSGSVKIRNCVSLTGLYLVCQSLSGDTGAEDVKMVFVRELPAQPKISCFDCPDYQKVKAK